SPQEVSRSADILFITTSDTAIQSVVSTLADSRAIRPGQIIIHMSGALSSEVLDNAKEFGAMVLSVHPLQSFAGLDRAIANLPGSVFSIEGDEDAYDVAVSIVEALEGEYFFIDSKAKPLYHAGACAVSNYLVTVVDLGIKLLEAVGISRELASKALLPLINGTVKNIENLGIPQALTGPIARGDLSTVSNHLLCLEQMAPELLHLYSCLGYYTASIASEKATIDQNSRQEFEKIFLQEISPRESAG
ncbi:MAG: DUF2520 domain-containing protein, partial [Syntrophomonadaceae bacterium]|nr:DUF2520 domain-containing protein [Syntrophomonadaceae bacterium]